MAMYSVREVAERLNTDDCTVRGWIYKGWLKAKKGPNKAWLIRYVDLMELLRVHPHVRVLICHKYLQIAKELGYPKRVFEELKLCASEDECEQILRNARVGMYD